MAGSAIDRFDYKYDAAGRKLRVRELSGDYVTWTYDAAGQLTGERRSGANAYRTTYVYDPAGNRTLLYDATGRTTSVYDNANRLRYSVTTGGRTTYTFDHAGNQVSERTPAGDITTNTWDADSRLVRVELPSNDLITYTWAPVTKLGEMRQLERDDGTTVTRLVWDNQNVVEETDDLNAVDADYTYQPQPYGHLVSDRRSGASSFYKFDDLKSTISQTNSGGTVTDEYRYKAFGPSLYHTGSSDSPYTYVGDLGYRQDEDTGNTNLRERENRSSLSRFLSPDPLGERAGDSNFYRYAGNDPINRQDPSGLGGIVSDGGEFTWEWYTYFPFYGQLHVVSIGTEENNQVCRFVDDGEGCKDTYCVSHLSLLQLADELKNELNSWKEADWDQWFKDNGTARHGCEPDTPSGPPTQCKIVFEPIEGSEGLPFQIPVIGTCDFIRKKCETTHFSLQERQEWWKDVDGEILSNPVF